MIVITDKPYEINPYFFGKGSFMKNYGFQLSPVHVKLKVSRTDAL